MSKFQIGDTVRVKSLSAIKKSLRPYIGSDCVIARDSNEVAFTVDMSGYCGRLGKITNVQTRYGFTGYAITFGGEAEVNYRTWTEEMLIRSRIPLEEPELAEDTSMECPDTFRVSISDSAVDSLAELVGESGIFEVGRVVRVKSREEIERLMNTATHYVGGLYFNDQMFEYCGRIAIITDHFGLDEHLFELRFEESEHESGWVWNSAMLELTTMSREEFESAI